MVDPHSAEPADTPRAETPGAPSPDATTLERERDDFYDRLLRKTAEFDNYRKRIDRERREQSDQTVSALLIDILSIVDDFDRALAVQAPDSAAGFRKGVELIHAKFEDMLRRQNVKPIQALGTDFDPNLHQAVMHESSPAHREGEVIGELQRGYTIGDRLLRPAMVKVAKA